MQATQTTLSSTVEREIPTDEAQCLIALRRNQIRAAKELWRGRHKRRGGGSPPRCITPLIPYPLAS